jgi:nucleoside-diphosphate kinase
MQNTLSIIKPDAVKEKYSGKIIDFIEQHGLNIIAQKRLLLNKKQAEIFYEIHKDRPFFTELVEFMISGPVVIQILQADNAVELYRNIMGATDPSLAEENTIRKLYGQSIQCNAVHGSDSIENAKIESSFFFSKLELTI